MQQAMKNADSSIASGYKTQMKSDVDELLINYRKSSHSDFATATYDFLMEKFYWRDWLVISYNELSGGNNHWQRVCSGYLKFRDQGINIAIASVPRSRTPIGESGKAAAEKIIDDLDLTKTVKTGLFKTGRKTVIRGAEEIYKQAPDSGYGLLQPIRCVWGHCAREKAQSIKLLQSDSCKRRGNTSLMTPSTKYIYLVRTLTLMCDCNLVTMSSIGY